MIPPSTRLLILTLVPMQCGGQGWTGATTCPSGWSCTVVSSIYYSQCLPGAATTTAATLTTTATGGTTGTATGTATSSAASGTTTLMTGYSFIRGVVRASLHLPHPTRRFLTAPQETPYFHQYLQSETLSKSSDGVLGSPGTASQFVVSGGQLQQYVTASSVLYGQVEARANSTVMKLKLSWAATPAATGTFVFSGDTLEWSTPDITRPQDNVRRPSSFWNSC